MEEKQYEFKAVVRAWGENEDDAREVARHILAFAGDGFDSFSAYLDLPADGREMDEDED